MRYQLILTGALVLAISLFSSEATSQHPAGSIVSTSTLSSSNSKAWGLAYRKGRPARLYVSDESDDRIYVYERTPSGLAELTSERIDTAAMAPEFTEPRGLAFEQSGADAYLYALTSHENSWHELPLIPGRDYASRLWRYNLTTGMVTSIDLNQTVFGIAGLPVHGLEVKGGVAFISYETTLLAASSKPERKGILRFPVGLNQFNWAFAAAGFVQTKHMPNSGRVTSSGQRSPCFGLGLLKDCESESLWGTSYNKYLYVQEPEKGRGLFHIDSPGEADIYGVAAGDGCVFVVDRVSGGADQIHEIDPGLRGNASVQKDKTVRHVRFELESSPRTLRLSDRVYHTFATPPAMSYRPNQNRDYSSYLFQCNRTASVTTAAYNPAGDTSARCYPRKATIAVPLAASQSVCSSFEFDVCTSFRRQFVYPNRCNILGSVSSGYLADSTSLYGLSDTVAFGTFVTNMQADLAAEYGSAASLTDRYWLARDVLEYIKESYSYGNTGGTYHPANTKVVLPFDGIASNELLSCSSSTFAFSAVMRWLNVPTRWVATTRRRSIDDANGDGYWSGSELAIDESYHRWAEVYLGSNYGWQRFDPTPSSSGPREMSQFELTESSACGVSNRDLVMHVGSRVVTDFYRQNNSRQWYNAVSRYSSPSDWQDTLVTYAEWSNPCLLQVSSSTLWGTNASVTWTTSGPWDLDYYGKLVVRDASGNDLSGAVSYRNGSVTFSTAGMASGSHQLSLVKQEDARTGSDFTIYIP
jgi:hypothetical protein